MKWHYDPDKFMIPIHYLQEPDLSWRKCMFIHVFCEELCLILFFTRIYALYLTSGLTGGYL